MNTYMKNIILEKGDTYSTGLIIEGLGQTVDSIYFTCRENLNDSAEILFQSGINNGISMVEYDEEKDIRKYAVRIAPEKTRKIQSGTYYYDLQISVNNDVFTVMKGNFVLEQDCTREDAKPEEELVVLVRNSLNEINGEVISEDVLYDLDYLEETKTLLKEELNKVGTDIHDTDTFRSYVEYATGIYEKFPKVIEEGETISANTNAGKMSLKLKSNEITQSGTPSSDSPVDVNVIKGNNTISICNKNLLGLKDLTRSNNGITGNVSNNEIILNGTATNNAFIRLDNVGDSYLFNLKAGTYTLSANNNIALSSNDYLRFVTSGGMAISGLSISLNSINASTTFTLNEDLTNIQLQIRIASGTTLTDYVLKPQLEFGTASTEYVSSKSQNFSINLDDLEHGKIGDYEDEFIRTTGKQLFDKDNANLVQLMKASGGDYFISTSGIKSFYIKVKPNTKYTIQKRLSNRFYIYLSEEKPDRNVAITTYLYRNTATSLSVTTGTNDNYLTVYFWHNSDTLTEQEILDTIMINEGEEMLPYEPYGVNEWYLKENVGKVVLDGTETYTSVWSYPDVPRYGVAVNLANAVIPTAASQHIQLYSNRFVARKQEELWTAGAYSEGICIRTNYSQLIIKNNNITTATTGSQVVTDFKNWISNNNIKVAYPLATPKYTKISSTKYPILRNQLEDLYNNSKSYDGQTNITQTNASLPFIIEMTALMKGDE